jgi:DNA-directed RNA polymerase alpha subunit
MEAGLSNYIIDITRSMRRIQHQIENLSEKVEVLNKMLQTDVQFDQFREDLPTRLQNVMLSNKIDSFEKLCSFSRKDFMDLPNVGRSSLSELMNLLGEIGLDLKPNDIG